MDISGGCSDPQGDSGGAQSEEGWGDGTVTRVGKG